MFTDEVEIILKAGHGGAGKVSFYPGEKSGPDGGNGGKGGDIYLRATSDLTALKRFTHNKLIEAENGQPGSSNRKFGRDGQDREVVIPVGSVLKDKETGEQWELETPDQVMLISKGGKGGRGNYEFKSPRKTTPMYAQPGLEGEKRYLKVELKLIAQFGLIGLPNAGKSSLLNELTMANVRVANYPFTTLEPSLAVFNKKIIADIPGLIEGAHQGKGLGIKFLKHIEKVSVLLHCISVESADLKKDYKTIRDELKEYNSELLAKKEIILLTKSDLVSKEELKQKLAIFKKMKKEVYPISIHDWDSLELLKNQLS